MKRTLKHADENGNTTEILIEDLIDYLATKDPKVKEFIVRTGEKAVKKVKKDEK